MTAGMSRPVLSLCSLGARALPTAALVRLILPRAADDAIARVVDALRLAPAAREAALLDVAGGARVLAAVELGRRAGLPPSPCARVAGPADAVAVVGPRLVDDPRPWLVALDVRGRVARLTPLVDDVEHGGRPLLDPVVVLQRILLAGCRRGVVVRRVARPSAPLHVDVDDAVGLQRAAGLVGVDVVDVVLCGDDGWSSLLRLGHLAAVDGRYR
jgi:hypothetical protein